MGIEDTMQANAYRGSYDGEPTPEMMIEHLDGQIQTLLRENEQLRTALERLLNDSMFKDHPEASQMAIDALSKIQSSTLTI